MNRRSFPRRWNDGLRWQWSRGYAGLYGASVSTTRHMCGRDVLVIVGRHCASLVLALFVHDEHRAWSQVAALRWSGAAHRPIAQLCARVERELGGVL